MGTYSFELDFRKPLENDVSGPSIAQIYIKNYSTDTRGYHFITPYCISFEEVDEHITRLERELKNLRKEARQKFTS